MMMSKVKYAIAGILLFAAAMGSACSYAGATAVDKDTVVITKNNAFLFGLLNQVYVCQVSDSGLQNCSSNVSP
jgi:hypothetical protein